MQDPTREDELKREISEWAKGRAGRDKAAIRLGFIALAVIIIGCAIWFVIWKATAGPVTRALVAMRTLGIDLPESRLTYPLDGAPLLEEQWGVGKIPESPLPDEPPPIFFIVHKGGEIIVAEGEKGASYTHPVVVADKSELWSAIRSRLAPFLEAHRLSQFWLAVRSSQVVGEGKQEVMLEAPEMSSLGVVPVAVFLSRPAGADAPKEMAVREVDGDASFAGVVRIVEQVYSGGKSACLTQSP